MRLRLLERQAAFRVHQVLGIVLQRTGFEVEDGDGALAGRQGASDRFADPLLVALLRFHPVHDKFDEMDLVAVQGLNLVEFPDLPVDPHLDIAPAAELVEEFAVMALAAPHERSEEVAFPPEVFLHDQVHDLFVGVADHLPPGSGRIGPRSLRIQKPQEIIDFRDGPDRGAGVVAGCFLLDGDDRAETVDVLHLGLLEDAHEMLRIGGQRVHIAPLPLRMDRIEGQGGLAAAGQSRHHHELVPRDVDVDIFQVVGFCAAHLDVFSCHGSANLRKKRVTLQPWYGSRHFR